jgi:hypothetical protein
MSNVHFDLSLKLFQGEVHDFSGEVQKFSGEVRTSPQNPAMVEVQSELLSTVIAVFE